MQKWSFPLTKIMIMCLKNDDYKATIGHINQFERLRKFNKRSILKKTNSDEKIGNQNLTAKLLC